MHPPENTESIPCYAGGVSGPAGIPFGNYQLLRRLARGGMAEVFLARQGGLEGFHRVVALKRILPHLVDNDDFVRMFLDEARLAAQLSHPNVIHIYEFGKVDEHYFIAMEFMPGVHVGDLIRHAAHERLPETLVARIGADACVGLHYAHCLRDEMARPLALVHRDVSPPNLLVSYDGVVKIVDFGIAKAASCVEETRTGVVKGKYAYMSPEQTTGKKLDGRSDVFSLGLVLWELLAGRVAVTREDQLAAMRMIRDGQVPDIREVRPDLPEPLVAALSGALAVKREDRMDARDFGVALEEYIKGTDHIASSMDLGQWIIERFPPQPLVEDSGVGTVQATQATRATAASAVALAGLQAPSGTPGEPGEGERPTRELGTPAGASPLGEGSEYTSATLAVDSGYADALYGSGEYATTEDKPPAALGGDVPTYVTPAPFGPPPSPPSNGQLASPMPRTERVTRRGPLLIAALLLVGLGSAAVVVAATGSREQAAPAPAAAPVAATPGDASVPVVVEPAVLDIVTRPAGATVLISGRSPLASPASFEGVEPGTHRVEVSLAGYQRQRREVTVVAGEHRTFEIDLEPVAPVVIETPPDAGAPAVAAAEPEPDARPRGRDRRTSRTGKGSTSSKAAKGGKAAKASKKAPVLYGELKVRTRPYSVVYHRGRKLGTTPFAGVRLEVGRYKLTFKNPDRRPVTRVVEIEANQTAKLDFEL